MELIDKEKMKKALCSYFCSDVPPLLKSNCAVICMYMKLVDSVDVVEAEPVKYGEWIFRRYDDVTGNADYECSNCHHCEVHNSITEVKYCWNCGALMDLKEEEK